MTFVASGDGRTVDVSSVDWARPLAERDRVDAATFDAEILASGEPVVLRGQVSNWPAVVAASAGRESMARYIAQFDCGAPVQVMAGKPEIGGRFFYDASVQGFNFHRRMAPLRILLAELLRFANDPAAPALYAGSAPTGQLLPGWSEANSLDLTLPGAKARVWIGNATRVSTHYDGSANVACVVAGRRRFLLFPPEQLENLYVGPLEHTLAGQPVSMVDPDAPDLNRYPRFAEAMRHALVAELGPGDAIFIPALWWHNVHASEPFNVLVNYWGENSDATSPFTAMIHALMAVRDLPPRERAMWRKWFDHYVFDDAAGGVADHLPEAARGVLGPAAPSRTDRIRQYLVHSLGTR